MVACFFVWNITITDVRSTSVQHHLGSSAGKKMRRRRLETVIFTHDAWIKVSYVPPEDPYYSSPPTLSIATQTSKASSLSKSRWTSERRNGSLKRRSFSSKDEDDMMVVILFSFWRCASGGFSVWNIKLKFWWPPSMALLAQHWIFHDVKDRTGLLRLPPSSAMPPPLLLKRFTVCLWMSEWFWLP